MKRYNVDVNLAWSYDHHSSREVLDETPSPEGKWVLAEEALPIEAERDELCARVAELETERRRICVIFDGYAGRFVEVENEHGASIRVGEWRERDDGLWSLDIDRCVGTEDSR